VSQWNALLRSAAGYQAFRQIHPEGITPARVVGFLLLDPRFPRSVALCVGEAGALLGSLRSRHGLRGAADAAEELDRLRAVLSGGLPLSEILRKGLHEFLDMLQRQLIAVTDDLAGTFFGRRARLQFRSQSEPSGSQSQSQSQSGPGMEWWPPLPPLPPIQS
jgi:uncharacterized alpha-E superfamily protein